MSLEYKRIGQTEEKRKVKVNFNLCIYQQTIVFSLFIPPSFPFVLKVLLFKRKEHSCQNYTKNHTSRLSVRQK